jgi:large subunit ribosomal protein L4
MAVDVRGVDGATTGSVDLEESIFAIQPNVPVMHQVVTAQLAAARAGTQSTKTRAEVSGGGRKPFKQKGTGRARQGSERAPHYTGGGVALGPKPRSYRQRTPRKMIQLALRSALSDRASDGKVVVVDRWPWETPSTKDARKALEALGLDGKILIVLSRDDEAAYKSYRNLTDVQLLIAGELNAYDVLCNDWIVFTTENLPGGPGRAEATSKEADVVAAPEAAGTDVAPTESVAPSDESVAAADESAGAEESAGADESGADDESGAEEDAGDE